MLLNWGELKPTIPLMNPKLNSFFPDTQWTLVDQVKHGDAAAAERALEALLSAYWYLGCLKPPQTPANISGGFGGVFLGFLGLTPSLS
jgi:hypothetical protein